MTPQPERDRNAIPPLRIVAWEITTRCDLACRHCRASATTEPDAQELSPAEALEVVEQLAEAKTKLLILSGGDPLLRPDWPDIAARASALGMRVTMAPNGLHVDAAVAARMRECGIERAAISLDFPTAELHDEFRGVPGAFDAAVCALSLLRDAGIERQINATLTALNVEHLDALIDLAVGIGAAAFHPFLLVETGRGEGLADQRLTPERCEEMMLHLRQRQIELAGKLAIKPTDMPHYCRVVAQHPSNETARHVGVGPGETPGLVSAPTRGPEQPGVGAQHGGPAQVHSRATGDASSPSPQRLDAMTRGCLAGRGFCFISSRGDVNPCGYLPLACGSVRVSRVARIWRESAVLRALRDDARVQGKCGVCEFRRVCGGCRARAFAHSADWMSSEPLCAYIPRAVSSDASMWQEEGERR
jgi:radical SAM protein with 4Fe4S-binding SPASM domain